MWGRKMLWMRKQASMWLALGLTVGSAGGLRAEVPTLPDIVPPEVPILPDVIPNSSAPSTLDQALQSEVFHTPYLANAYCPPARRFGLPPMMGDFFPGYAGGVEQRNELDRLLIVADDLDAPLTLPALNQRLTITESGPLGIFRTNISSAQQIQATLRAGQLLPPATQVGTVNENATLTTAVSIAQAQAILANTPGVAFDIIPVAAPPGSYLSAVDAVFQTTNTGGTTEFDRASSGAILQGGLDTLNGGEDLDAFYFYSYIMRVNLPTPSAGTAGVGRSRIAENGTTTPQDRIFLDYGYFDRVNFQTGGTNINRFTPGFEKTIANGAASLEVRIPMATTVSQNIIENGTMSSDKTQLGNVSLYLKGLLMENNVAGVSGGLGVVFPTADGFDVSFQNGGKLVEVDNESYHLQPFLAGYYAPNERFFTQGFAQLDFDANGNSVALNPTGTGLQDAGTLHDSTFLFLDWSIGYWLIRGDNAPSIPISSMHETGQISQRYLQLGLAPTFELHYARSLEDAGSVSAGPLTVGNFTDSVDTLTMVVGTHLEIGENTNIGLGYATSLTSGNDQPFDGAFRLTLNQFFGRK